MKKLIAIAAMIAAFGLGGAAAFAAGTDKPENPGGGNDGQVCPGNDTGHIGGGSPSVTATAPDGKLISGYCVKAGSENQGNGPESATVDPPQKTVTISHSSGKDISHYSLSFVDEGETTTTETETTTTTETETEPPTTTTETEPPTTTTETEPPTTTTETQPPRMCPDGLPPTPGEGAFDPNDDCARPPTTTTTTTTTESTPTVTAPAETTVADPVEEEVEDEQADDPPVQKVKSVQVKAAPAGPKAVVAPASASKPSKAAQPAPFTP